MTYGYAAILLPKKQILVKSISVTERAAKVNYLVAYAGVFVFNSWSDERINDVFDTYSYKKGEQIAEIRKVNIEIAEEE